MEQGGFLDETKVVVGRVDRCVYRSDDDGFAVMRLEASHTLASIIVVGTIGILQEGDEARFVGAWTSHARFGRQFKVTSFQKILPATTKGVQAYLARVPDVGPKIAERLVDHFGASVLEIIQEQPERVREVNGIGKKRASAIVSGVQGDVQTREALIFLQGLGIPPGMCHKILINYGAKVIERVRSDPFSLAEEVGGIGFRTADQIAKALGIAPNHPGRIRAGVIHALIKARDEGHLYVPRTELIQVSCDLLQVSETLVDSLILDMCDDEALIQIDETDDWIGIPEHLELERYIAKRLRLLLERPTHPKPSEDELDFARAVLGLELDQHQCAAIAVAVQHPVAVVTGGPGTGKTTILQGTLSLLQRRGLKVALAAPTGRAARRLTETTGAKARTLHRLLEYSPQQEGFVRGEENPLLEDVVIVDEVSMVDVPLMAALCAALKPSASLLLVGDADQLPSVGPGLVFHDILNSDVVPIARLEQIYRQAKNSLIVQNAHRILRGKLPVAPEKTNPDSDFFLLHLESPGDIAAAVEAMIARRIPKRFGLDPVYDVQVLVPMHRGDLGAQVLNERIQNLLNPNGISLPGKPGLRVGDRIIQTKNNYELDVANGDVGILLGPGPEDGSILVRFDERDVCFPKGQTDALKLAYALSIHKSQGSEYPAVIIPLHTQHFMMLKRNLIYTAVTRGRSLVVLVGSKKAVQIATQRNDAVHRYTILDQLLQTRESSW